MIERTLRQRKYFYLRSKGYTPYEAVFNIRCCSDYFWQKIILGPYIGSITS